MAAVDCAYTVRGEGPAVFMVHGIGSRRATWEKLVDVLATDFTCVSYDLRGHGESPVTHIPFSLENLVEDLEALREKLGIEKAHVIGHSLGGMIGPAYARAFPDRVMALGLLSTAAGRTEEDRRKLKAVISAMEEKGIEPVLGTLIERWYTDDFIARRPDAIQARIKQVTDTPPEVFMNVFHIYAETEMAPWLAQVKAPCLVMTGEFDGGCNPRLNRFIADNLPDATLEILPDLKHSILVESPALVADKVGDYLRRH